MRDARGMTTNRLSTILERKAIEIAESKRARPVETLQGPYTSQSRGFRAALSGDGLSIIAEIKRRSPSKGTLRANLDVADTAAAYARAGAAAVSVLTDQTFFGGALDDLTSARSNASVPILRKDFIIDPYSIHESRFFGADAVLLIVRVLGAARLAELISLAAELDLDALVEVHTPDETRTALDAGAAIIGINNRNLDTFDVDRQTALDLRPLIPPDRVTVAESGMRTRADVMRMADAGFHAVLIGESLMTADDPEQKLRELMVIAP